MPRDFYFPHIGEEKFVLTYESAIKAVKELRKKFGGSGLFGVAPDQSFKSSIASIYQTFDGKDLYPSIEEKAANLLYFIVKNHSFVAGNKRIAASMSPCNFCDRWCERCVLHSRILAMEASI